MSIQPTNVPAPCYRCIGADIAGTGPLDGLCYGCRAEVNANRADARDELVATVITRHHSGASANRPDVRLLPLTGPQSPGKAWA